MSARPHFLQPLLKANNARHCLVNERTGAVVATQLELASDSRSRNRGLLGRSGLEAGGVMIIAPCTAIHTFFMQFTIDIIFVDRRGTVLKLHSGVRPWRARGALRAFAALELAEGSIERLEIAPGDRLSVTNSATSKDFSGD